MPITPTYPGVYIEEVPSAVHTIIGVATSITAFVGRALRGPLDDPIRVQSLAEFERVFGGLWIESALGYSVQHFFLNGGSDALIIRVAHNDADRATVDTGALGALALEASTPGTWGNHLRVRVDTDVRPLEPGEGANTLFNLSVKDMGPANDGSGELEVFRNLSVEAVNRRFVTKVLEQESALIRVSPTVPTPVPATAPPALAAVPPGANFFTTVGAFVAAGAAGGGTGTDGDDGSDITFADVEGGAAAKTGINALEKADLFNILVLPPLTRETDGSGDIPPSTWNAASAYCLGKRAMLIIDPPSPTVWKDVRDPQTGANSFDSLGFTRLRNSAIYFPRVRIPDPLKENRLEDFAPGGVLAGIWARTDVVRGVFKAPAGLETAMVGVRELTVKLTDGENGQLNPLGFNCLRSFPVVGNVVWGARTLVGADLLADQWKYIPVRRTALFIEESLYRGTQFAVFEPNDEPLWAQLRLNIGAFMQDLFRKGAFQGSTPRDAYLVKCDKDTTTQNDIDKGIVNILVGFAPLKPAEFIILKIQQLAGNIQT
jgi:phage tail sheath protein FI